MATETATEPGSRHIVINGLLPKGKYRTEHSYTPGQEEEMRQIAILSAQAVLRKIDPKLIDQVDIEVVS